jgi:circadian clock protein KaiC
MIRAESGIKGLDEIIEGGFPFPSVILVAGEPGTGKTTFSMQSLFHGAKKGEGGMYFTAISEPVDQVHKFMSKYSFYDRKLVDDGMIKFMDVGEILVKEGPTKAFEMIVNIVRKENIKRAVIDPISPFSYVFDTRQSYRKFLHDFFVTLRALETLTILVAETPPQEVTKEEVSYMADGLILLHLQPSENPAIFKPGIQIRKMKGTEHSKDILRLGFTKDGMRLL